MTDIMPPDVNVNDGGNILTRQYGPLPGWAWGVSIAGGLGVAWYFRTRATRPGAHERTTDEGTGGLPGLVSRPGQAVTLPTSVGEPQLQPPDEPEITDNRAWREQAFRYLNARGIGTIAATIALDRYLSGRALDEQQAGIIDMVLREVGSPPDGAPPLQLQEPEPSPQPEPSQPEPDPTPPDVPSGPAQSEISSDPLIRFRGSPATYAIRHGSVMEWIPTRADAVREFGPDWMDRRETIRASVELVRRERGDARVYVRFDGREYHVANPATASQIAGPNWRNQVKVLA